MTAPDDLRRRAARHAALGDPVRLAIVDELATSDRAPIELRHTFGLESNLLAHHLDVLEDVGLINRTRSSGDGRRRYVHLLTATLDDLHLGPGIDLGRAVFVCTRNSARSQLAAALWDEAGGTALSAGTHPAEAVHPGAIAAATRAGLVLDGATPKTLDGIDATGARIITVCDQAHEELGTHDGWLHWSIPDPVPGGKAADFDHALTEIRTRITTVTNPKAA